MLKRAVIAVAFLLSVSSVANRTTADPVHLPLNVDPNDDRALAMAELMTNDASTLIKLGCMRRDLALRRRDELNSYQALVHQRNHGWKTGCMRGDVVYLSAVEAEFQRSMNKLWLSFPNGFLKRDDVIRLLVSPPSECTGVCTRLVDQRYEVFPCSSK